MSLVERALQKAQLARAKPEQTRPIPAPVETVGVVAEHSGPADPVSTGWPTRPGKTIRIDRAALRAAGLLPMEGEEREIADQYRAIKRPLIRTAFGEASAGPSSQLIMMASALSGDGKTFTCINLALSMSLEKDHSVLLVDGDVAKPHVSRVFGVDKEPGLLDVLGDPTRDIESVILSTEIPRLSVLPAGRASDVSTELLASARMSQVMARLSSLNSRGIVLMDSPPILLTSEARVLAGLVGQIVLVVKAGQTPQQAVQDSIDLIGAGRNVRLVLNQADLTGPVGYYYGYRYGYAQQASEQNNQSSD